MTPPPQGEQTLPGSRQRLWQVADTAIGDRDPRVMLDYAREQLLAARQAFGASEPPPAMRVRLGLLAAMIALAERSPRLDDAQPRSPSDEGAGELRPVTADLVELVLRQAKPRGAELVRLLVDRGGRAGDRQLREDTGLRTLVYHVRALNEVVWRHNRPGERPIPALVNRFHQPGGDTVSGYALNGPVDVFAEALGRLQSDPMGWDAQR